MFYRLHNYKHVNTVIVIILSNLSILKVNLIIQYGFYHVTNSYHFELFNLLNISKPTNQTFAFFLRISQQCLKSHNQKFDLIRDNGRYYFLAHLDYIIENIL